MITDTPNFTVEIAVTGDLKEGAKLRDCRRFGLSETQAIFDPHMSEDQWLQFGRGLRVVKDRFRYFLSDWMKEGKRRFGPDKVLSAVTDIGFDPDDVDAASQLTLFPAEKRHVELSERHHQMFAWLIEQNHLKEEDVDRWVLIAREESLTDLDLKGSVIHGHVVRSLENKVRGSNRSGFTSIHGISATFGKWLKGLSVDKLETETKLEIIEETNPMAELNARLKAEIAGKTVAT